MDLGRGPLYFVWEKLSMETFCYPLDSSLERFTDGERVKYYTFLQYGPTPVIQDLPAWFTFYTSGQMIEGGIKESKFERFVQKWNKILVRGLKLMDVFWEKIEERLAGEFNLRALSPALFFWGAGVFLWGFTMGWDQITSFLTKISVTQGVILAIGLLIVLELSTWIGDWLKLPVLQFLEGYWSIWVLNKVRKWITGRIEKELQSKRMRLDKLALKNDIELSEEEKKEFKKLEVETDRYPEEKESLLPTRLGNLLRVSEQYPYRVYGLEILTVFPRLWLILPERVQKEVSEARSHLDNQIKLIMLGIALFLWAPISWWIIPIGILIAIWGYWRALAAAETYGLLLRATFDLYRFDLYNQLHLNPPEFPLEEIKFGLIVTQALARGFKSDDNFKHPEK